MSNLPINFEFNTTTVRVVEIDGDPWFVSVDICKAIYGVSTGLSPVLKRLSKDQKRLTTRAEVNHLPLFRGSSAPSLLLVSESGLYQLIMRSDKPEARAFQDWVTGTVLPSIRKDGGYIMGEEKVATGEMSEDEMILKTFEVLRKKCKRYEAENKAMEEELTFLTIQKWAALNYLYPSHSDKGRLTTMAKNLCIASGIEIKRIERQYTDAYDRTHQTYSNIYPRHLIDQAAMELGMVESVRPVSALH